MASPKEIQKLQEQVWNGSLPLEIRLAPADCRIYDEADPYMIHVPRLSYLPFLLPRLHAFFSGLLADSSLPVSGAWFSFETLPLKWHYPIGLLYDLFSGAAPVPSPPPKAPGKYNVATDESAPPLPWSLVMHYSGFPADQLVPCDSEGKAVHDAYINSVKEADFLRNGSAKAIMTLSREDSTTLWEAVKWHDLSAFARINAKLLPPLASLRHVPLRVYLPSSQSPETSANKAASAAPSAHLRVVQALIPPLVSGTAREAQTLGTALHALLPALFPSRRTPMLARPVLHGVVVPLAANLDALMRGMAYADGWLSLGVKMMG